MTGWIHKGQSVHNKEKIYALLRIYPQGSSLFNLLKKANQQSDEGLQKIKRPQLNRVLHELQSQGMVNHFNNNWSAMVIQI